MGQGPVLRKRGKGERLPLLFEIRDREGRTVVPPMYLLINPQNFSQKAAQLINRYNTRGAWIEENYGEQLDEVSASGSTAGFVSKWGLVSRSGLEGAPDTEAYRAFEALIAVYRNNGEAYYTDGQVVRLGSVWMSYDGGVYMGYFVSFSVKESADRPFAFQFDFVFKVTRTVVAVVR